MRAANLLLVTLLLPPVAINVRSLFLGESFSPTAWIGFVVIAFGFAITDGRVLIRLRHDELSSQRAGRLELASSQFHCLKQA